MAVVVDGGTGVSKVQDGVITAADMASGVLPSNISGLDDFASGDFTPVFKLNSPTGTVLGTTVNQAKYVKVGTLVHIMFHITKNDSTSSSDNLWMTGLPYVSIACPQTGGGAWFDNTSTDYRTFTYNPSGSSNLLFPLAGSSANYLGANSWTNGRPVYGSVTYIATS